MPDDVEALVLDPSFRGTDVERSAHRLGVPVRWHGGLVLRAGEVDENYRGRAVTDLAATLGAKVDARVVGDAVRSGRHDPQQLKKVWHHLAAFGRPDGLSPRAGTR